MRTILCLILFCLQEEPHSSKQGGCAGRPQRAGQAGAADGGWEEPGANVGGGGEGEGPRIAAPLKICLWIDLGQNNTM